MAKMKCKECGKIIDDDKKICSNCGFKNKIDISIYFKEPSNNTNCKKCGSKLNKKDSFCTNCGCKKDNVKTKGRNYLELLKTIFKRNKIVASVSIVLLIISLGFIIENNNFQRDIKLAESYYNSKEFYKAGEIVNKYSHFHKNNEFIKKYEYIKYLLTDYQMSNNSNDDSDKLKYLLWGYRDCLERNTNNAWENDLVNEVTNIYYNEINKITYISKSDIEKICIMSSTEMEQKINELIREEKKKNTCNKVNVSVVNYWKYGYKLDVILKNNNGCTWNIKSYSEVRVYFTDNSYEDVYLSTNINLKPDEKYTFSGCYLGSDNEDKTIKSVTFID